MAGQSDPRADWLVNGPSDPDLLEEPSDNEKEWAPDQKPPAEWFNWYQDSVVKDIADIAQRILVNPSSGQAGNIASPVPLGSDGIVRDYVETSGVGSFARAFNAEYDAGNDEWTQIDSNEENPFLIIVNPSLSGLNGVSASDLDENSLVILEASAVNSGVITWKLSNLSTAVASDGAHSLTLSQAKHERTPIGGYLVLQSDLSGIQQPPENNFVKLTAGLTGTGEYNEGKLGNESVSGSFPKVTATAEIVDGDSPLNGEIIHLLNTEERYLMPGESPGATANDQFQGHYHNIKTTTTSGSLSTQIAEAQQTDDNDVFTRESEDPTSDGSNGSPRTGKNTNVKHIETSFYMRIS